MRQKSLILFDPITCERKNINFKTLVKITGKSRDNLSSYKSKKCKIKALNAYILDDDVSYDELIKLMENEKLNDEYWLNVPETNGKYKISSYGRVKSFASKINKNGKFMIPNIKNDNQKLLYVTITIDYKKHSVGIHRLIATTFLKEDINNKFVIHKNGIPSDNRVSNIKCADKDYLCNVTKKAHERAIAKIDSQTGEVINEYRSIMEAAKENFVDHSCIRKCLCKSQNICAGFRWKYVDE